MCHLHLALTAASYTNIGFCILSTRLTMADCRYFQSFFGQLAGLAGLQPARRGRLCVDSHQSSQRHDRACRLCLLAELYIQILLPGAEA